MTTTHDGTMTNKENTPKMELLTTRTVTDHTTGVSVLTITSTDYAEMSVTSDSSFYPFVRDLINSGETDWTLLADTVAGKDVMAQVVAASSGGRIEVQRDGTVLLDGVPQHSVIAQHIADKFRQGDSYGNLLHFLERLQNNPSDKAIEDLFSWLLANDMVTIDEDGYVVGHKGITREGTSVNSGVAWVNGVRFEGQIPYAPGDTVHMPRNMVCDDREVSCAPGLHIGTHQYAFRWGQRTIAVRFDPAHVVSVPNRETCKMRVEQFQVICEIDRPIDVTQVTYYDGDGDIEGIEGDLVNYEAEEGFVADVDEWKPEDDLKPGAFVRLKQTVRTLRFPSKFRRK